jgi:hypothetical protein
VLYGPCAARSAADGDIPSAGAGRRHEPIEWAGHGERTDPHHDDRLSGLVREQTTERCRAARDLVGRRRERDQQSVPVEPLDVREGDVDPLCVVGSGRAQVRIAGPDRCEADGRRVCPDASDHVDRTLVARGNHEADVHEGDSSERPPSVTRPRSVAFPRLPPR